MELQNGVICPQAGKSKDARNVTGAIEVLYPVWQAASSPPIEEFTFS